jgi:hypothetical protein
MKKTILVFCSMLALENAMGVENEDKLLLVTPPDTPISVIHIMCPVVPALSDTPISIIQNSPIIYSAMPPATVVTPDYVDVEQSYSPIIYSATPVVTPVVIPVYMDVEQRRVGCLEALRRAARKFASFFSRRAIPFFISLWAPPHQDRNNRGNNYIDQEMLLYNINYDLNNEENRLQFNDLGNNL